MKRKPPVAELYPFGYRESAATGGLRVYSFEYLVASQTCEELSRLGFLPTATDDDVSETLQSLLQDFQRNLAFAFATMRGMLALPLLVSTFSSFCHNTRFLSLL